MKYLFTGISYIFHPFILPMLGVFILFQAETLPNSLYIYDSIYFFPDDIKAQLFIILAVLTFVAPALSMLIMYWNRLIPSLELGDKKDRIYPFIVVTFYYILAYGFLRYRLQEELQHVALMSFLFGIILTFIVSFIINFYLKISLHAAAIFGVAGMVLAYNQSQIYSKIWIVFALILAGGLISSSRIYLKAHNLVESVVGMFVGFFVMYLTVANNWFI